MVKTIKTKKQSLTEWERLAVEKGLQQLIDNSEIHAEQGKALLDKLQKADKIITVETVIEKG